MTLDGEESRSWWYPGWSLPSSVGSVVAGRLPLCKPLNRWQLIVLSSAGCTCLLLHIPPAIFFFFWAFSALYKTNRRPQQTPLFVFYLQPHTETGLHWQLKTQKSQWSCVFHGCWCFWGSRCFKMKISGFQKGEDKRGGKAQLTDVPGSC